MLLKNNHLSPSVTVNKTGRFLLPRLRKPGSRFLNAMVILSMVLPNLTIAVQAAAPEKPIILPREDTVSTTST